LLFQHLPYDLSLVLLNPPPPLRRSQLFPLPHSIVKDRSSACLALVFSDFRSGTKFLCARFWFLFSLLVSVPFQVSCRNIRPFILFPALFSYPVAKLSFWSLLASKTLRLPGLPPLLFSWSTAPTLPMANVGSEFFASLYAGFHFQ